MLDTPLRRTACIVAAVIYAVIFVMNVMGLPKLSTDMGNHVFVLACFVFTVVEWRTHRDDALLVFMALTLAGDIMTGFDATFAIAVAVLFVSQIVLSIIIWRANGGKYGVVLRVLLVVCGLVAIAAAGIFSVFYAFGIVYFTWFVANAVQALMAGARLPLRFRVGTVLYVLGDVCLIGNILFAPAGVLGVVLTYGTWMIYLPAVLALALSPTKDPRTAAA